MTRKQKAKEIALALEYYFPQTPIPLEHVDPYTLLIAVLLSAQCTDVRVNQVTPLLFDRAASPLEMTELSIEEIQAIIRPCGLSKTKANNISRLSRILLESHSGVVPDSLVELEELPGVGHKTASVVVNQAFGIPSFPVDTHIHRLAYRWGLSNGKNVVKTEGDLKKIFPEETWGKVHLQMIFFGRKFCPARGHRPLECPICNKYGIKSRM